MASTYRFLDYELDVARFDLRRDGRVVHVEPQVIEVLAYLLEHRDRLVSKTELLDAVWGDRFVSESALASRLMQARRAIGDDGHRQEMIVTVHGRGYRFVASVSSTPSAPVPSAPTSSAATPTRMDQEVRYCVAPDGTHVAYACAGTGPPLVKAANWLTHLEVEWSSPIWTHWLHELARDHRLVRYDERGCGLSDWDTAAFDVDSWVADLELVVAAAGVEGAFPLLGISQGGAVAIAYAVRHPERVSRLVLVGAYVRGRLVRAASPEEREEAALDLELGKVAWRRDEDTFRQVFASQFLPDATPDLWRAFNDLQRATTSTENVVRFLEVFAHIDVTALAPRVRCPTLVVHARGDLRVPRAQAQEIAGLVPDSRLVTLESRNHILTATEPAWPGFLEEVRRFLAG
ncbi:MAG: alpha/beta fold hydrolase [Nocardioides sp.]|uniref:alpha/beta fold hydrolase n=1 Tax=Nocardioides sp. TaxID=35761 RepID=UPI0039E6A290